MKLAGVILAGGLARRMGGGDKGLLRVGGRTLLEHVVGRLGPQVATMVLNANGDPARFAAHGLPVLPDTVEGYPGPLAGVLTGLDWAAEAGLDGIVTVAADTPFFPEHLSAALIDAIIAHGQKVAMAATRDDERGVSRHPTFALWTAACRDSVAEALDKGNRKVVAVSDPLGCTTCVFDGFAHDPFFNVNTPDDMARAEAMAEALA